MQTAQGSLVILNPHTQDKQVFWNGSLVPDVKSVKIDNDNDTNRVVIVLAEHPEILEMQSAGITIRRS